MIATLMMVAITQNVIPNAYQTCRRDTIDAGCSLSPLVTDLPWGRLAVFTGFPLHGRDAPSLQLELYT